MSYMMALIVTITAAKWNGDSQGITPKNITEPNYS